MRQAVACCLFLCATARAVGDGGGNSVGVYAVRQSVCLCRVPHAFVGMRTRARILIAFDGFSGCTRTHNALYLYAPPSTHLQHMRKYIVVLCKDMYSMYMLSLILYYTVAYKASRTTPFVRSLRQDANSLNESKLSSPRQQLAVAFVSHTFVCWQNINPSTCTLQTVRRTWRRACAKRKYIMTIINANNNDDDDANNNTVTIAVMRKRLLVLRIACTRVSRFQSTQPHSQPSHTHTHSSYDSIRDVSAVIPVHKRGDGIGAPSATAPVQPSRDTTTTTVRCDANRTRSHRNIAQTHKSECFVLERARARIICVLGRIYNLADQNRTGACRLIESRSVCTIVIHSKTTATECMQTDTDKTYQYQYQTENIARGSTVAAIPTSTLPLFLDISCSPSLFLDSRGDGFTTTDRIRYGEPETGIPNRPAVQLISLHTVIPT